MTILATTATAEAFSRQTPSCDGELCSFSFIYELVPAYVSALESINGVFGVYNLGFGGSGVTYNSSILTGDYTVGVQRWEDAMRVSYGMTLIAPDGQPPPLCLLDINGQIYGYYSVNGQMVSVPNDTRCPI